MEFGWAYCLIAEVRSKLEQNPSACSLALQTRTSTKHHQGWMFFGWFYEAKTLQKTTKIGGSGG